MRAMMVNARMTATANAAAGSSCAHMGFLLDAILASIIAILGILRVSLLVLAGLLALILRRFAAGLKDAQPRFV